MQRIGKRKRETAEFGIFTLPAIVCVLFAFFIPFFMSMKYSFTEWNGIQKSPTYIGWDNFKNIFSGDNNFVNSSLFTLKYSILYIVLVNAIAIILAVILDQKLKSSTFLRTVFFIPYIISLIIVGFIWKFILAQGFTSLSELTGFSVFDLSWLGEPRLAFFSILAVSIWQSIGFYIVIYIAGLQSISPELLEAATVDGAGPFRRFFSITFPLLAPAITVSIFMSLTNALKVFDIILSLTGGGPGGSTYSVTLDIYRDTFQNNMYGYGTAKALLLFVAIMLITIIQLKYFKSKEVEA
ncbi:carbohydrate ABC transporter permease [Cohnella nanjingensis]|uniref:Sugar ABC transporter permease n=1 Tax=Cohnella nanjingensis TaxID=1387779 RepID=A0A7X0VEX9_9BACL|nr:sugar ABC transporter permease [Cohnella nanjingensis]MBB6670044.1 sugar ABC transporter permease [Cohnella nanjingensis]